MARMPTRDDLPQAIASANTAVVRAPTNNVGASIAGFGDTLGGMARVMARANREEQKKNGVMERAKATAFLQRGLIETNANYTYQNKPDTTDWQGEYQKGASTLLEKAGQYISDPEERQLFMLQGSDDVTRYTMNVGERGRNIENERTVASTALAMEELTNLAAIAPDNEERARLLGKRRELGKGLVDAGLKTPEAMAKEDVDGRRKVAGLVVEQTIMDNPDLALGALTGKPTTGYVNRLANKENARRDPKARPKDKDGKLMSSALGLFQMTHKTWEDLRKKYPKLGLTKSYDRVDNDLDGRLDKDQQMRAMNKLTELNAADLRKNGFVPTEANLYLAHFAGLGRAVEMLQADPGAPAEVLFAKEAEANPRHFTGKTVAGALASLTKGFNGQPIEIGPEYASLSAEQRIVLEKQARSASNAAFDKGSDEWETDTMVMVADEAGNFDTREEALNYVREQELSSSVRLKAETLVNSNFNTKEAIEEKRRVDQGKEAMTGILDAIDQGDQTKALEIARAIDDPVDRKNALSYAQEPPRFTTAAVTDEIDALRYSSDAADQSKFLEIDFGDPRWATRMSPADRRQAAADQVTMKSRMGPDGKDPVFMTTSQIGDSVIQSMRLKVSGKEADEQDIAVANLLRGEIQGALTRAYDEQGGKLTQVQMNDIANDAVINWHTRSRVKLESWWTAAEGSGARLVSDAFEDYQSNKKTLPLPVLQSQFLQHIEAAEKRDRASGRLKEGERYSRAPGKFAEYIYSQAEMKE